MSWSRAPHRSERLLPQPVPQSTDTKKVIELSKTVRHRKGSRPTEVTDLMVRDLLAEPALVITHELRVIAPALVLVLEKDAPPRFDIAGVYSQGDAASLQEHLDSDELALAVRWAFYEHAQDDPVLHERRDRHADRLEAGETLASLRVSL
jgi:hypothetical protein